MTNSTTGTTQPQALRGDHDIFDLKRFVGTRRFQMAALATVCLIFAFIAALYLVNFLHWSRSPDFGGGKREKTLGRPRASLRLHTSPSGL